MHRDPESHNKPRLVQPSSLAKTARDEWVAGQGGEDAVKARIAAGGGPSTGDLARMAATYEYLQHVKAAERLRQAVASDRMRELRRARRLLRLYTAALFLVVGSWIAGLVWYVILGHH